MIDILPSEYHVGVINVSVAGAKIQLWDREDYKDYIDNERDWMKNIVSQYGGNPYERLVNMARLAQKDGVIKGILMHQGESNSEDPSGRNVSRRFTTIYAKTSISIPNRHLFLQGNSNTQNREAYVQHSTVA